MRASIFFETGAQAALAAYEEQMHPRLGLSKLLAADLHAARRPKQSSTRVAIQIGAIMTVSMLLVATVQWVAA